MVVNERVRTTVVETGDVLSLEVIAGSPQDLDAVIDINMLSFVVQQ
jgi:hypothetical protein